MIEEAAQAALDTADHLLGILDRMDATADDGKDTTPGAEDLGRHDNRVTRLRDTACALEMDKDQDQTR